MLRKDETICAPATAGGGAIAVIRISGPRSIEIVSSVFSPNDKRIRLDTQKGYTICYGEIYFEDDTIDEVLISVFRSPHSYTGEDSIEISCHASSYIQSRIMQALVAGGAIPAQPGEFTMRAFLNGKLDLSQAEAVADLISSETEAAHRIAVSQLKGTFSDEISILRAELLHFASLIELELDFGEEDVEFADRGKMVRIVSETLELTNKLVASFSLGSAIKNGVPVVLAGRPNTGKSTLLNRLLNEDRALVSEIPGTTRDSIEDECIIEGFRFRFIDTAGLRETDDHVENLGINRTLSKIVKSEIVLLIADINEGPQVLMNTLTDTVMLAGMSEKKLVVVMNKTDISEQNGREELYEEFRKLVDSNGGYPLYFISAGKGTGIEDLKRALPGIAGIDRINAEDVIISNIRHYDALLKVSESLERVRSGLNDKLQEDLIAMDIRNAIHYLGELTGEITNDEILGNIFRNFCIGK
jgi:tRNA modification GTPase